MGAAKEERGGVRKCKEKAEHCGDMRPSAKEQETNESERNGMNYRERQRQRERDVQIAVMTVCAIGICFIVAAMWIGGMLSVGEVVK